VRLSVDRPAVFDLFLESEQARKMLFHGKAGKLPFNDPGEPDQRADIIKADGQEGFLRVKGMKACGFELFLDDAEALIGVGERRRVVIERFDEAAVIVCADLLGDEASAGLQDAEDFSRAEGAVAVEDEIEGMILKGQRAVGGGFFELDAKGKENLPAQPDVGRIGLDGGGIPGRVIEREQEFAAAGVHIENAHIGAEGLPDDFLIIPRERGFFVFSVDMGEIPAVDVGDLFFGLPGRF